LEWINKIAEFPARAVDLAAVTSEVWASMAGGACLENRTVSGFSPCSGMGYGFCDGEDSPVLPVHHPGNASIQPMTRNKEFP
jgi:hypothetical protein